MELQPAGALTNGGIRIKPITKDGMADGGAMQAELMGTPGFRRECEQGGILAPFQHPPAGEGGFPLFHIDLLQRAVWPVNGKG